VATSSNKKQVKLKTTNTKKKKKKPVVKKKKNETTEKSKINSRLLVLITFFSGIVLTVSTYAWLSVNVNVKIKSLNLVVSSDSGLFISLDGVNFSESIEISVDSVIHDLENIYPNNTNQWAGSGLWPVSTNGIKGPNDGKFSLYQGQVSRFKNKLTGRKDLNTIAIKEDEPSANNSYIAFDVFLKNVSNSPVNDNLYLDETSIDYDDNTPDDVKEDMAGVMNSMRFGFIKIGTVPTKSPVGAIQNIPCNSACQMIMYEPNSSKHSAQSTEKLKGYNIDLKDGTEFPTYAIIAEGRKLEFANGQEGTNIPPDTDHFALQKTVKNFTNPIFSLPNGITKLRAYIWIEGQDLDSLETNSKGAEISISINFVKDLAGYEE
jgi:hypothetical protein